MTLAFDAPIRSTRALVISAPDAPEFVSAIERSQAISSVIPGHTKDYENHFKDTTYANVLS